MKRLWKPNHSVTLSLVVTYLAGAALLALMIYAPTVLRGMFNMPFFLNKMIIIFYACCPAGWTAIVSLLLLLHNIRKGEVFTRRNVKLLRLISWCFVFVALATLYPFIVERNLAIFTPILFITFAAAFLAILVRVVKNVMEQATIMREEQELTI